MKQRLKAKRDNLSLCTRYSGKGHCSLAILYLPTNSSDEQRQTSIPASSHHSQSIMFTSSLPTMAYRYHQTSRTWS